MISSKAPFNLLCLSLLVAGADAYSHVLTHGGVAPMPRIPSEQWIEKIIGDMDKPGQPFVIRIHHDSGNVILPHTHPEDENITVLTGSWAVGMGSRVNMAEMDPMEPGALGFVPKKTAHFGYAKIEAMLQGLGIGPFVNLPIGPVFELTSMGVLAKPSLLKPGVPPHPALRTASR